MISSGDLFHEVDFMGEGRESKPAPLQNAQGCGTRVNPVLLAVEPKTQGPIRKKRPESTYGLRAFHMRGKLTN
jgi:hypothetical protein